MTSTFTKLMTTTYLWSDRLGTPIWLVLCEFYNEELWRRTIEERGAY